MFADLIDTLPPPWRLALSYAPGPVKERWLTLLALDERLGGVARPVLIGGREPIMAQIRLAWWRDRLREPAAQWPKGEPLLAALACWDDGHGALGALVDGWEALLADRPLNMTTVAQFVAGRQAACAALAGGSDDALATMARGWALGDLIPLLAAPEEQAMLAQMTAAQPARLPRLSRAMRPLVVLAGLAQRVQKGGKLDNFGAFAASIRLGLFGT
ncbi:hypothetical protein GTZ99_06550 [Novosphingobium sp. FSY-8]|uniref:Phytoene synthase n=1 Tax=Novosphingobium ovatum TaxID=1908523 RepID=A0ABW9XCJ1_9SPHN|nr:hypothetical protein [Novosphingobium ovatum]NBC36217.1 hypothetical protein [Novosphingobium ovatum]